MIFVGSMVTPNGENEMEQPKRKRGRPQIDLSKIDQYVSLMDKKPLMIDVAIEFGIHPVTLARAMKQGRVKDWRKG